MRLAVVLLLVAAPLAAQDFVQQARDARRRGQLDSAYAIIQRAVEAQPNRAEAHYWLGEIAGSKAGAQGGLGALALARRSKGGFARAVELEPDNLDYIAALAGFLGQAPGIAGGDRDSAIVLAERVRQADEGRGTFLLADVLRRGDDSQKARADSVVDGYARGRAGDRVAQLRSAAFFAQTERPERALAVNERLAQRDTSDAVARYGIGRNLVVLKRDLRRAIAQLRWVLTQPVPQPPAPSFLPAAAWWRIGQAYAQLGVPDSARAAYQEALRLTPDFRPARLSLDSLPR